MGAAAAETKARVPAATSSSRGPASTGSGSATSITARRPSRSRVTRRAGRQAPSRRRTRRASRSCRPTTSTSSTGASRSAGPSLDGDLAAGPARLDAGHRQGRRGVAAGRCRAHHRRPDVHAGRPREAAVRLPRQLRPATRRTGPRGAARRRDLPVGPAGSAPALGGRDFSMWTGVDADPKWWAKQKLGRADAVRRLLPVLAARRHPRQVPQAVRRPQGRADPVAGRTCCRASTSATTPDLSPGTPLRNWLERTKTPFYILTNYASRQLHRQDRPGDLRRR